MDALPVLSFDLVEALDKQFPLITTENICRLDREALKFRAGQRSVVEFLLMVQERTKEVPDF